MRKLAKPVLCRQKVKAGTLQPAHTVLDTDNGLRRIVQRAVDKGKRVLLLQRNGSISTCTRLSSNICRLGLA